MTKKMILKRAISVAACLALIGTFALVGCSNNSSSNSESSAKSYVSNAASEVVLNPDEYGPYKMVEMKVKGYDPVQIKVFTDQAPITTENFLSLVENSYYNGKTFYRFVPEFCMQGGTKGNNAAGNDPSLTPIKGEFSSNGVENVLADNFSSGVVAMARSTAPDSASSTFFVTMGTSSGVSASLDGKYAAFGFIDKDGMKVIDKIFSDGMKYVDSDGIITKQANQPVIESMKVLD